MSGKKYSMDEEQIVIGRKSTSTVCFPPDAKGISREHCVLFKNNGKWLLMDIGSTYGTYIEGKGKLNPNEPIIVKQGDTFYVGQETNRFVIKA